MWTRQNILLCALVYASKKHKYGKWKLLIFYMFFHGWELINARRKKLQIQLKMFINVSIFEIYSYTITSLWAMLYYLCGANKVLAWFFISLAEYHIEFCLQIWLLIRLIFGSFIN